MLSQPSAMHVQAVESAPPAAAVFVSAMMHMQQKITELADQLEANQTDNLALTQLLRERAQKPAANDELWAKVAGALGLTNSAWGMLCVCPRGRDRNLISTTLTYAFIGDCFLTRQALHDLFATLEKPTEEEVYSTALPIIYSTLDEAWRDLYVLTDAQFDHARTRPFVSGRDSDENKLKNLLAFIKQSQGLSDPPHVRVERSGTRTDIALESIGPFCLVCQSLSSPLSRFFTQVNEPVLTFWVCGILIWGSCCLVIFEWKVAISCPFRQATWRLTRTCRCQKVGL